MRKEGRECSVGDWPLAGSVPEIVSGWLEGVAVFRARGWVSVSGGGLRHVHYVTWWPVAGAPGRRGGGGGGALGGVSPSGGRGGEEWVGAGGVLRFGGGVSIGRFALCGLGLAVHVP